MNVTTMYQEIQTAIQRGEQIVVATVVKTSGSAPCEIGSKLLIRANGSSYGSFAGPTTDGKVLKEGLNALHEGRSYTTHIHIDADQGEAVGSCGATLEVFFEALRPEPRLIIAGAGYVAQALARLALRLDFHIDVIDDRRDLANPAVFDERVQLIFGDIAETIRALEPGETSWIVIVTRGHTLDKDTLRAALATRASYIGMIGSPSKVRNIFKELLKEGVTRERLEQIHAPIGLDLGAETPDEIALSIAAEMVMLRRKGTGISLNSHHKILDEVAHA